MSDIVDFNSYQKFTESMAVYNEDGHLRVGDDFISLPWLYPAYALAEEVGEVTGKIAKFVRKSKQFEDIPAAIRQLQFDVGLELGDALFQLSETARKFGWTLQEIADANVTKLSDRRERGVIVGEGDSR